MVLKVMVPKPNVSRLTNGKTANRPSFDTAKAKPCFVKQRLGMLVCLSFVFRLSLVCGSPDKISY